MFPVTTPHSRKILNVGPYVKVVYLEHDRPDRHYRCGRIMGEIAANPHLLLRQIVENELPPGVRISSRTVSLAEEAKACEVDRYGSFDRDVERESNEWHEREERQDQED